MTSPSMLYHYTTNPGLIGIVTHCELWASDCQFLNDGTELSYARDIYFAEIQKLGLALLEYGEGYSHAGPSLDVLRMFIVCFCEDGDLLSQWRGYSADQGYALGFDTEQLQSLNIGEKTTPFQYETIPVQYGIANPTEYFKQEIAQAYHRSGHPGMSEYFASEHLLPRLAQVKNPGFAEEHEWRMLIQMPLHQLKEKIFSVQFRPSSMGPIAYLVVPFPPECLREIIIGPGTYAETREIAVRNLLEIHNLEHVNVIISKIPYRK